MGKEDLLNDLEDKNNWRINGEKLERTNDAGEVQYFYDKIEGGILAFRKLVLVGKDGVIDLSFFAKLKLHKKVIARGYRLEQDQMKMEIHKLLTERANKSIPKKSKFQQRLEEMQRLHGRTTELNTEDKINAFHERVKKREDEAREKMKRIRTDRDRIRDILNNMDTRRLNK